MKALNWEIVCGGKTAITSPYTVRARLYAEVSAHSSNLHRTFLALVLTKHSKVWKLDQL